MYTRSYYPEEEKITVPEKYDGYAFSEENQTGISTPDDKPIQKEELPYRAPWDIKPESKNTDEAEEVISKSVGDSGILGGLFKRLPISNIFGKFDFFKNGFHDIGTEEILIIGVALFLLLSKGGDKECAILLLLFVK